MTDLPPLPSDPEGLKTWADSLTGDQMMAIIEGIVQVETVGGYRGAGARYRGIDVPLRPEAAWVLTLNIELRGSNPKIWRRLRVRGEITLDQVHRVIQAAMGWTDSHRHRFHPGSGTGNDRPYFFTELDEADGDHGTREESVRLDQVLRAPGDVLTYIYDFGDHWVHRIKLESISSQTKYNREPMCLGGARACPPEGIGGIRRHNQLAAWLRAGAPAAELPKPFQSVADARRWLPAGYEPDYFDSMERTHEMAMRARDDGLPWLGLPEVLVVLVRELKGQAWATASAWLAALDSREPQTLEDSDLSRAVRPWRALFDVVGTGTKLTEAGKLPPASVARIAQAAGVTDWWTGTVTREDLTWPVAALRDAGQEMGLLYQVKGTLTTTTRARNVACQPDELVAAVLRRLPLGHDFESEAGWFALLGAAAGVSGPELHTGLSHILTDRGWGDKLNPGGQGRSGGQGKSGRTGKPVRQRKARVTPTQAQSGSRRTLGVLRLMSTGVGDTDQDLLARLARARLFGFGTAHAAGAHPDTPPGTTDPSGRAPR